VTHPLFELRSLLFSSLVHLLGVFPLFIYLLDMCKYVYAKRKGNEDNKNISIKKPYS